MSILLDALRKSESNQKPVEFLTIHSGDHVLQESASVKSSHVILLITIALVLIGWLLWKQYQAEDVGYSPPVELPAGKAISKVPTPSDTQRATPVTKAQETVNATSGRPRTPVENYEMSKAEKNAGREELKATVAATAKVKRAAAAEQRRRAALNPATPKSDSAAVRVAAQSLADGSAKSPRDADNKMAARDSGSQGKSVKPDAQEYQSPEPEPIGYWELPDSVRDGVPVIKFSVLVYAEQPEDRFVLINGERLMEGDQIKPGLVIEHIRRDGVVFTYQLYQFFVKR